MNTEPKLLIETNYIKPYLYGEEFYEPIRILRTNSYGDPFWIVIDRATYNKATINKNDNIILDLKLKIQDLNF